MSCSHTGVTGSSSSANIQVVPAEGENGLAGRQLSVTEFDEVDFTYDGVNSPGASSTSSEPIYIRQPGFDYHAHEVRVDTHFPGHLAMPVKVDMFQPGSSSSSFSGQQTPVVLHSNFFPSPPATPSFLCNTAQASLNVTPSFPAPQDVQTSSGKFRTGNHSPPSYSTTKNTKKKKSSCQQDVQCVKPKIKREPLPMKLRALPHSFWQQPNKTNNIPPSCSTLPPLILGKDVSDVIDEPPVTAPGEKDCKDAKPDHRRGERIIKVGNTDLLFRLFDLVEKDDKKVQVVRRGRPKKSTSTVPLRSLRDDDPCLVSTATESILPLLPDRTPGSSGSSTPLGIRQAQGQQVLEFVNIRDGDRTLSLPSLHPDHNYSQLLSELVLRL